MAESKLEWKWVAISVLIFVVVQVILNIVFGVFGLLTLGFGFILFVIVKPITYLLGGIVTGYLSPGVTIREPAIGAVIVSVAGIIFDSSRSDGTGIVWLIISGVVAFLLALAGAQIGERRQRSK